MKTIDDDHSTNPYAAPQAELHDLSSAHKPKNRPNYLRQGVVAGLQLGGLAAFFIIIFAIGTWGQNWTINKLILIPIITLAAFTLIGTIVGGVVHLLLYSFASISTVSRQAEVNAEIAELAPTNQNSE